MSERSSRRARLFESVRFHGIADKGAAVGRDPSGEVVFARGPVPGDLADVVAQRKKGVFQEGEALRYREFAEDRQAPFCQHFGVCGGCSYQHLRYEAQLDAKDRLVKDAYARLGGFELALEPILGAPQSRSYRNKMEYAFSQRRWLTDEEMALGFDMEHAALGFHRRGAWNKVLDIRRCHLQDSRGDELRNTLRSLAVEQGLEFYDEASNKGFLRNVMFRILESGEVMLLLSFGESRPKLINRYLDALLQKCPFISSLYFVINTKANDSMFGLKPQLYHGKAQVTEEFGHVKFHIGPLSFFQTNTRQAIRLYDVVAEYAGLDGTQNLYDLYAGVGSIGLYLARKARQVVAIEEIASAVDDARENARLNGIENFIGYAGDVGAVLDEAFAKTHGKPDIVVTDPPRAGMHAKVVELLLALRAPRVVYVSCNPATQARDLRLLVDGGYKLKRARAVDMFPQTPHCEAVALLEL